MLMWVFSTGSSWSLRQQRLLLKSVGYRSVLFASVHEWGSDCSLQDYKEPPLVLVGLVPTLSFHDLLLRGLLEPCEDSSCEAGWSYIGSLSESSEKQILGHCYQGQMGFLTSSLILSLCISSTIILAWNVRLTAKLALFQSIHSFDPHIRCNSFCCVVTMIFL